MSYSLNHGWIIVKFARIILARIKFLIGIKFEFIGWLRTIKKEFQSLISGDRNEIPGIIGREELTKKNFNRL